MRSPLRDAYQSGGKGLAVILRRPDLNARDVLRTVLQLIRGRVVFSPTVIEQLVSDSDSKRRNVLSTLTPPELAVLELVAMGLRNAAIARRIGRSQKLVEKHIGRTFAKLGLLMSDAEIDRRVTATRIFLLATAAAEAPGSELVPLDRAETVGEAAGAASLL